ncbi:MAG TPA: hypothetical protein VI564_08685 [Candidatus Nanoarchaeia archaeon]|nr:hypothetical protein [Candidatus Nanoarchaeia archaeon]
MKKEDKEKLIMELRHKYIESLDNWSTSGFYQRLGIIGGIIVFVFSVGLIKPEALNSWIVIIAYLFLIYIIYTNNQYSKYVDDLYEGLFLAIKGDKLLEFEIKKISWFGKNIYYKRKLKK